MLQTIFFLHREAPVKCLPNYHLIGIRKCGTTDVIKWFQYHSENLVVTVKVGSTDTVFEIGDGVYPTEYAENIWLIFDNCKVAKYNTIIILLIIFFHSYDNSYAFPYARGACQRQRALRLNYSCNLNTCV